MGLPSYMHKFAEDATKASEEPGDPPNAISAGALDKNYVACLPINQEGNDHPYTVDADESGWQLKFSWWPPPQGGQCILYSRRGEMIWLQSPPPEGVFVLGSRNGVLEWIGTEDC